MRENEVAARELATAIGEPARVAGAGVHWRVEIELADRAMRVHCFWYEPAVTALMLGMNPSNARSSLRSEVAPYEGPEFAVTLLRGGVQVADGRTRYAEEAAACARLWIADASVAEVVREVPFIDAMRRAMQAIAETIDPRLRWDIGGDPSYELWIYGDGRSCRVMATSLGFFVGQVQVAFAANLDEVAAAVAAWLLERVPVRDLAPRAQLEAHAELVETDPAGWHWQHVRDRIADPEDALAELRPLIERLAESRIATRFYSYSSLNRLCFSASSHYPWVGDYSIVSPGRDGAIFVGTERCDLATAVARIEAELASSPIEPFFGSAANHELPAVVACFAAQSSTLRPELRQRAQWTSVWVGHGARQCSFAEDTVTCIEGSTRWSAACGSLEDAVSVARRFLEDEASFPEIASDARVVRHW